MRGFDVASASVRPEPSMAVREAAYRRAWDASRLSDLGWELANQNATPLSELAELIATCKAMVDATIDAPSLACSSLEDCKAGLADAHSKSPSRTAMPKEEDTHG